MYLRGKRYISAYDESDISLTEKIGSLLPEVSGFRLKELTIRVGYWRKANHIHNWFVENVQEGEDNCESHYVSREDLTNLKNLCLAVLDDKTKAEELLPATAGFFFAYGDWYFGDLGDTIKIIDNALNLPDCWEFEYQSSC